MAAPTIPPIRLGPIGTGLAVEKLHWPALCGLADRYVVTAFTDRSGEQSRRFADYSGADPAQAAADRAASPARDDVDAVLISVPIPHLYEVARDALTAGKDVLCERPTGVDAEQAVAFLALAARYPDRTFVGGENFFCRDGLRYARALLNGGAIGNYTASYPEIPVPPEPNDMRLYGTEGVLAGSESERRVTRSSSDATTHTTVFRGIDNGYRAEFVDPVSGAVPVPLWLPRGSTGLFDGLPGQRISSSASFAA